MSTREELLIEKTFKNDGEETSRRVYNTLISLNGAELHRTSKLLALLVEQLEKQGILSDEDIDNLLFNIVT